MEIENKEVLLERLYSSSMSRFHSGSFSLEFHQELVVIDPNGHRDSYQGPGRRSGFSISQRLKRLIFPNNHYQFYIVNTDGIHFNTKSLLKLPNNNDFNIELNIAVGIKDVEKLRKTKVDETNEIYEIKFFILDSLKINDLVLLQKLKDRAYSQKNINKAISELKKSKFITEDLDILKKGDSYPEENLDRALPPDNYNIPNLINLEKDNDQTVTGNDVWLTIQALLDNNILRPIFNSHDKESIKIQDQNIRNEIQKKTIKSLNNFLSQYGLICKNVIVTALKSEKYDLEEDTIIESESIVLEKLPSFASLSKRSIDKYLHEDVETESINKRSKENNSSFTKKSGRIIKYSLVTLGGLFLLLIILGLMGVWDEETQDNDVPIAQNNTNEIPIEPTITPTETDPEIIIPSPAPTPTPTVPPNFMIDSLKNEQLQILYNVPIGWQKENIAQDTVKYLGDEGDFIIKYQISAASLEDFSENYLLKALNNGFIEQSRLIQSNDDGELEIISTGKFGIGNREIIIKKRNLETFSIFRFTNNPDYEQEYSDIFKTVKSSIIFSSKSKDSNLEKPKAEESKTDPKSMALLLTPTLTTNMTPIITMTSTPWPTPPTPTATPTMTPTPTPTPTPWPTPTPTATPYVPITTTYQTHEISALNFSMTVPSDSNLRRFAVSPGHPNFDNRELLFIYDEKVDVDFVVSTNISNVENDQLLRFHQEGTYYNSLGLDNIHQECYVRNPYKNETISNGKLIKDRQSIMFHWTGLTMDNPPFNDQTDFLSHLPIFANNQWNQMYLSLFEYTQDSDYGVKPKGEYVARQFCFEIDGLIFNFTVSSKTDPFHQINIDEGTKFSQRCLSSKMTYSHIKPTCLLSNYENETEGAKIRIKQFFNALETISLIDVDKNKSLPLGQLKANYSGWE